MLPVSPKTGFAGKSVTLLFPLAGLGGGVPKSISVDELVVDPNNPPVSLGFTVSESVGLVASELNILLGFGEGVVSL